MKGISEFNTVDQGEGVSGENITAIESVRKDAKENRNHFVWAPEYLPPAKWNQYFDWPPPGGMRHLIFHAETNGFSSAIKRVGRSILINVPVFWKIVGQSK